MAAILTYQCLTCNVNLGAGGADVTTHLASYPTHSIREIIYDNSETLDSIEGTTRVSNGELYSYDESRSLWLSVSRTLVPYGIPTTNQINVYMRLWGTMTPTTVTMGYYFSTNSRIVSLAATRSAGTGTAVMSLRHYGGAEITNYTLSAGVLSGYSLTTNVAVSAGTYLCCYLSGTAGSSYPQLVVETARVM